MNLHYDSNNPKKVTIGLVQNLFTKTTKPLLILKRRKKGQIIKQNYNPLNIINTNSI